MRHFCTVHKVVEHCGSLYVCREPTVQTIHDALGLLWPEISVAMGAWQPALPEPVATLLPIFTSSDRQRLAQVLATCVNQHGAAPGELEAKVKESQALADRLLVAVLSTTDLEYLMANLDTKGLKSLADKPPDKQASAIPEDVLDQELAVMNLACAVHCSPLDVMQWPFNAFCKAVEAMGFLMDPKKPRLSDKSQWVMPGSVSLPGIHFG